MNVTVSGFLDGIMKEVLSQEVTFELSSEYEDTICSVSHGRS